MRNAHIPEPLRSVLNDASPAVPQEVPCPACGGSGYSPTTYMDATGQLQGDYCWQCEGRCTVIKERA